MENGNWAQILQEHEAKIGRLAELDSFAENMAQIRQNNDRIAQHLANLQVNYSKCTVDIRNRQGDGMKPGSRSRDAKFGNFPYLVISEKRFFALISILSVPQSNPVCTFCYFENLVPRPLSRI